MNTETKHLNSPLQIGEKNHTVELLCPAGDRESFLAAIVGGANAVYLGVDSFNARRNAQNFTLETLSEVCDLAHLAKVRVYLTLNTTILPSEFESALELARQAWYLGVDGLIVADLGLLDTLHREQPQIELHASTQTNVHSEAAVLLLRNLGASRVTLSRELALPEISQIAKTGVALEVFVHGALCFSYSGQCLMSSLVGCRSANRGLCAQPCRLPYKIIDTSTGRATKTSGDYLLSTADLSSLELLPSLVATGIKAIKIEGRMRKPNYVAAAAEAYSQALLALDGGQAKKNKLYSQRGFSTAYLSGQRDSSIMDYQRHNTQATASTVPRVELENEGQLFSKNTGLVDVEFSVDANIGKPLRLEVRTVEGKNSAWIEGPVVEAARSKAISSQDIQEHVGRVGSTAFSVVNWNIKVSAGAGIGFSTLHKLRRAVLEQLTQNILSPWHSRVLPATKKRSALPAAQRGKVRIAALVTDANSAAAAIKAGAQKIYYHTLSLEAEIGTFTAAEVAKFSKKVDTVAALPAVAHSSDLENLSCYLSSGSDSLVNNLGELQLAIEQKANFEIGPNLPTYNTASLELYSELGAQRVWLGPELSYKDLEVLAPTSPLPLSLTISGYQELMTSEHCVFMAEGPCDRICAKCKRRKTPRLLEDRKNYRFPVRTDQNGRSHIYNAISLDLCGELPRLMALGISEFVVDCTLLANAQIDAEVTRAARAKDLAVQGTGQLPKREGRTTGHMFRGVL